MKKPKITKSKSNPVVAKASRTRSRLRLSGVTNIQKHSSARTKRNQAKRDAK